MYGPFLATLDRGFWMIDQELFAYVRHPDPNNAGLGGQMLVAQQNKKEGEADDILLLNELINYQIVSTLYQTGQVAVEKYPEQWENSDACEALYTNIVNRTSDWIQCRNLLNERRLAPRVL